MHVHISLNLKPQLRKVYEPHNKRLFKFLGYSIPEWYDEHIEGIEGTSKSEEARNTSSLGEGNADPEPV